MVPTAATTTLAPHNACRPDPRLGLTWSGRVKSCQPSWRGITCDLRPLPRALSLSSASSSAVTAHLCGKARRHLKDPDRLWEAICGTDSCFSFSFRVWKGLQHSQSSQVSIDCQNVFHRIRQKPKLEGSEVYPRYQTSLVGLWRHPCCGADRCIPKNNLWIRVSISSSVTASLV